MHQERLPLSTLCTAKFAKLDQRCSSAIRNQDDDRYGVDPFFNPQSTLYNLDAIKHVGDFYNTSNGSGDINALGQPFAFFDRAMPGYPHGGFPVIFPVCHCFAQGSCRGDALTVLCFGFLQTGSG
jgi:hypothetical protein